LRYGLLVEPSKCPLDPAISTVEAGQILLFRK